MQLTYNGVFAVVARTVADLIGTDFSLLPETSLHDELAMDSLEIVDLGVALEKEFGIGLPDAQVRCCTTLEDVTKLVLMAGHSEPEGAVA